MKLMDFIPRDPEAIHSIMHDTAGLSQQVRAARIRDLKPIEEAMRKCIAECGPSVVDANTEFKIIMGAVCVIDSLLEACTKKANA